MVTCGRAVAAVGPGISGLRAAAGPRIHAPPVPAPRARQGLARGHARLAGLAQW